MIAHVTARKIPAFHRYEEEKFFLNAEGRKESVPSIDDPATKNSLLLCLHTMRKTGVRFFLFREKEENLSVVTLVMQRSVYVSSRFWQARLYI